MWLQGWLELCSVSVLCWCLLPCYRVGGLIRAIISRGGSLGVSVFQHQLDGRFHTAAVGQWQSVCSPPRRVVWLLCKVAYISGDASGTRGRKWEPGGWRYPPLRPEGQKDALE